MCPTRKGTVIFFASSPVEIQLPQLCHCLEPQPLVLGILERLERRLVEVLQQLHLLGRRDVVEDRVDGLLGVVAGHGRLDVGQELLVPGTRRVLEIRNSEKKLTSVTLSSSPGTSAA